MSFGASTNEAVPQDGSKAVKTRLLRGGYESEVARCCPIGLEQAGEVPAPPQRRADQCKKSGKAMMPSAYEGQKAQEHIDQQSRPNLPAHRIGAVAQENRPVAGSA